MGVKTKGKTRIRAAEIKFVRSTTKYTWMDYKRNEDILIVPYRETVSNKILKYKTN
jgi:hypothetical protein